MALQSLFAFRRALAKTADNAETHPDADWHERVMTTVAVTAAVMIVVLIAVLMGMVGP
jgi:hypothetical protein